MATTIIEMKKAGKVEFRFTVDSETAAFKEESFLDKEAWGMERVLDVLKKKTYNEKVIGIIHELVAYRKSDEDVCISGHAFRDY